MLKDTPADVFRMACVMSTYRSNMDYSVELIETAKNTLKSYQNFIESCIIFRKGILKSSIDKEILLSYLEKSSKQIYEAFCDDFNTPKVIRILNELISVTNSMLYSSASQNNFERNNELSSVISIQKLVQDMIEVFGINLTSKLEASKDFTAIMDILNEFRQNVRSLGLSGKSVELLNICDNVRDKLKISGITVKDHKNISSWSKTL